MEKSGAKASSSHAVKSSKQAARRQSEKVGDHSDIRNTLEKKMSEMNALHEKIFDEHNRLLQENVKLTQELFKLREENAQAIAIKDKNIEDLKKEVAKWCEKLERDVIKVDSLVNKNKELESKNREILERNCELNEQLCKLQDRLDTKDQTIKLKTVLLENKQRDIVILKEKTEQLLHIYEKSMKDKLKNISDLCVEICNQSSSTSQDDQEEAETTV